MARRRSIDVLHESTREVTARHPRKKAVLLKTLSLSLRLLHDIEVVHGDLKPGNVLIQKKQGNTFYTAKLIDFDDSYISGKPPERDSIPGDALSSTSEATRSGRSSATRIASRPPME